MAVTAAVGALAHLVTHEHSVAPMIGASASVSGTKTEGSAGIASAVTISPATADAAAVAGDAR